MSTLCPRRTLFGHPNEEYRRLWRRRIKRLGQPVITAALWAGTSNAQSVSTSVSPDWIKSALQIVENYEGSDYTAVTPDSDLQGLSVGVLQWTVKSGSLDKLIKAVGEKKAQALALSRMPRFGDQFCEIIRALEAHNPTGARRISLSFQKLNTQNGVTYGKELKPEALKELQAWLDTPEVRRGQLQLVQNLAEDAMSTVRQWKIKNNPNHMIGFSEFMFFFDAAVQGGLGGLADDSLARATKLVREWQAYTDSADQRRQELVNYLVAWLSNDWPTVADKRYLRDAKANAQLLRNRANGLSFDELHLLYMKLVRASVGNTPYQLPYVNRGIVDVLGDGYINGSRHDFHALYQQLLPVN